MSSIRVSGNTSGYYDLTVPDVAGQNTIPLNQVVTTDSNGNLGIGTTTPTFGAGGYGIEVKGTGRPTIRVTEETNTHAVQLSATDGAAILESRSANMDLVFGTSGVEKMRIDDTNGFVHMNSASQIRLTLGNEGTPGTNTANWIRGNAGYLQYNAANNAHTWEVGGTERMRLHPGGQLVTPQLPAVVALCTGGFSTSYDAAVQPWYDINPWTTTAYNNGGHFNTGTGLFTAPVAGYYHVCIALEAVATSNNYGVYILKNGSSYSSYVNGRIIGGNIRATPNLSATVNLAQNDTIGVRIYMSGTSSLSWDNNGYMSIHLVG